MFRLNKCGLPADPHYPTSLTELGYYINDIDEIRNIANPTHYFKYFITKNARHNVRHREAFNTAVRDIVFQRLNLYGMIEYHCNGDKVEKQAETIMHPDPDTAIPHIPIMASKNIGMTPRVVVPFGESFQDLGIFAQRIVGMKGGINAGSAVNFVRTIHELEIDAETGKPLAKNKTASMQVKLENPEEIDLTDIDVDHPGVILANTGQLCWARSQGKAISHVSWDALPRPSAVDSPIRFDKVKNTVPGHRNHAEHVASIFQHVIPQLCAKNVQLDIIALGDSCEHVPLYLDKNWDVVKKHMSSMAMICPGYAGEQEKAYKNEEFKHFLLERTRGYVEDADHPSNSPLFGPHGGNKAWQRAYGYNIYSLPAELASELVFPKHFSVVLEWIQKVAEGGEEYCENEIAQIDLGNEEADVVPEQTWKKGETAVEKGLIDEGEWGTDLGMLKLAKTEEEREEVKAMIKDRQEVEEWHKAEEERLNAEWEKNWGEQAKLETKDGIIGGPKTVDAQGKPVYEISETDTEHPELYEWHEEEGSDVKWRWMTKEESEASMMAHQQADTEKAEKKKKLAEQKAWKEKVGSTSVTAEEVAADAEAASQEKAEVASLTAPTVTEDADLPPSYTEATEICTKSSVEGATKSLINDMKALDIASHIALPATPQSEPAKQPQLHITNRTSLDDISDDEEEFPVRKYTVTPLNDKATSQVSNKAFDGTSFDDTATISINGTNDEGYMACPPERMERLPSDIALGLSTGQPEVKLTKDQKAAILQTTVLSSPVKDNDDGEGDRKISVVSLAN